MTRVSRVAGKPEVPASIILSSALAIIPAVTLLNSRFKAHCSVAIFVLFEFN